MLNYYRLFHFIFHLIKFQKNKNEKNAHCLASSARMARGIPFKITQVLLPDENLRLDSNSNYLSNKFVIKYIEKNLNLKFNENFKNLSEVKHTASIGQVHKAQANDEKEYSIKIKHNKIIEVLEKQCFFLNLFLKSVEFFKFKDWNFSLIPILNEYKESLKKETDYINEYQNYLHFYKNKIINKDNFLKSMPNKNVLILPWIHGLNLVDFSNSQNVAIKKMAFEKLAGEYLNQIFTSKFFQADTNLSNFLVSFESNEYHVKWIDFGNWRKIDNLFSDSLYYLISCKIEGKDINYLGVLYNLGFDINKVKHFENLIPDLINLLIKPFLTNYPFDLNLWNLKNKTESILGEKKWWFRSSGDSIFFIFMTSFYGIFKMQKFLGVNINWQKKFLELKTDFDYDSMTSRIPDFKSSIPTIKQTAQFLKILIHENGIEKINLEFPATSFLEIENLIPEHIVNNLKAKKINILYIKTKHLEKGLLPGIIINENISTHKNLLVELI